MARNYNTRHRAVKHSFKSGDYVRIRLPTKPPTQAVADLLGASSGSEGQWTYSIWLSNGQRWNARRCLLHSASGDENLDQAEFTFPSFTTSTSTVTPDVNLRRSARTHKPKNFGPDSVT